MARPIPHNNECSLFKIALIDHCLAKDRALRPRRSRLQWLLYIISLIFCHPSLADTRCDNSAATLESVEGVVEWTVTDGQWQQAARGDSFCYGDKIRVLEQRAALRLANDTVVRLRENSVVTLMPEEKGFWVELLQGAGHFLSRTPKQLTIKAAYLNAAIDGTEFVVITDDQRDRVAVFEGDVRVFNRYGEVRLTEGTETSATATTAPDPARSIRLRDAAEWILYYPPLIIQNQRTAEIAALMARERYADALKVLTQQHMTAEDASLAASLALVSGQPSEADRLISLALQQNPQSPDALALQALKTLTGGDDQTALSQTTALLQNDSQNVSVLLAHAYALQSQGKIEEALEVNRRALSLSPDNLFILARTAELELSTGNTRAARKLIDRALQKAPNHSRLNTLAGFIALNRFTNKEAQAYFHTAINSSDSEPLARLGLALALIQKGKIEEGRAEMEMAVLLDPGSSLLRSYLGKTYAAQDQNDWADTQYQLAKNLDPNDPTPWFYQAHLKHEENKPGEALRLITTAIEKNDNRAVYRSRMLLDSDAVARSVNLTNIYKASGFDQTAINTAALSAFDNPTDFAAHQALIAAYSDDPKAQILRSQETFKKRLLSPIGAKELPVGTGEIGLEIYPWASPGKAGAHEHTQLFTQRGISGSVTSTFGTQGSYGYDWLIQGIGQSLSISAGQYDYQSDGYRHNNDVNIHINEGNVHHQITDSSKLFLQFFSIDEKSGDLGNSPNSPLFADNIRSQNSSKRYIVGILHRISEDSSAIFTASKVQAETYDAETSDYSLNIRRSPESDQLEAVYIGDINNYLFQIGGQMQRFKYAGNIEYITPTNTFDIPDTENSKYRTIYTSISSPSPSSLRASISAGMVNIDIDNPDFQISNTEANYKLGALWNPSQRTLINLAHWKTNTNRIPDNPSWGMTEPFFINTVEDVTNFTEQKSTAIKFIYQLQPRIVLDIELRDSIFIENNLIVFDDGEQALEHDKTETINLRLNIEHQISPRASLLVSSEYFDSKYKPVWIDSDIISLTNFLTTTKLRLNYWQSASILLELANINQRKKTKAQENSEPYLSSTDGLMANLAFEFNWRNPKLKLTTVLYNLFETREDFHQKKLMLQSEYVTPSQPIWPAERSAALNITYQF